MSVLCQVGTLVWMTISQATIGSLASLLFLGALASRCSVEHRSSRWKTGVLAKGKTKCLAATCVVCRWSATFSHPMVPVGRGRTVEHDPGTLSGSDVSIAAFNACSCSSSSSSSSAASAAEKGRRHRYLSGFAPKTTDCKVRYM